MPRRAAARTQNGEREAKGGSGVYRCFAVNLFCSVSVCGQRLTGNGNRAAANRYGKRVTVYGVSVTAIICDSVSPRAFITLLGYV